MRRLLAPTLGVGCVVFLFLICFRSVLFEGEQFGYRDAAHFYYPLYERVEQEWNKGLIPLWDASENSGMPLLGNPTAAVLYPGKILYRLLPYPIAVRAYTMAHVALAFWGMYVLMRGWTVSRGGALISAMSYAFGAPVLFQYCNIIFLVGAAWVPFGLRAADQWLREARWSGIWKLALVLVMMVLGGDPQVAYVLGLCAGCYAMILAGSRRDLRSHRPNRRSYWVLVTLLGLTVWFAGVLLCAWTFPMTRPPRIQPPAVPFVWTRWTSSAVLVTWILVGGLWLTLRAKSNRVLPTMFGGLLVAAILAGLIASAQLLPVFEFTSRTVRAAEDGPHDIYPFSLEPQRLAEFFWPDLFGSTRESNRWWSGFLPPRHIMRLWVPSLYLGGLTIVMAVGAIGFRRADSRRTLMSGIAIVAVAASLGEFGSPLWLARNLPAAAQVFGTHDPLEGTSMRLDGKLRDGDGSVYSLMAIVLPGFGSFRYPSKLLTFACLGLCALAGFGLDDLRAGRRNKVLAISLVLATVSLVACLLVHLGRSPMIAALQSMVQPGDASSFGPFDAAGGWMETRNALVHGSIVFSIASWTIWLFRKHARIAVAMALVLTTLDLSQSNARLIITVPQTVFETRPEVLAKIEEAEKLDPATGPFRIHRMPVWEPSGWREAGSPTRYRELVEWERNTIQPKYGIPLGVDYTFTEGVAELYDYSWFFSPFLANRIKPNAVEDDEQNPRIVYHPRRGYDLWNTRYFVVPAVYANNQNRAFSSFLPGSQPVYPTSEQLKGEAGGAFLKVWEQQEDWRILKNEQMFPRSWIVHIVDFRSPVKQLNRTNREPLMLEMLYTADPYWTRPGMTVQDMRRVAYVEADDRTELFGFFSRAEPDDQETSSVSYPNDQTVEIQAHLKSNGLVILSDIDYPGWELTIDGTPAPILRVNRLMRGAAVTAGDHKLVYRYRPRSFLVGMILSGIGLLLAGTLAVFCLRKPRCLALTSPGAS